MGIEVLETIRRILIYLAFHFRGAPMWHLINIFFSLTLPLFFVGLIYSGAMAFGGLLNLRAALLLFIVASLTSSMNAVAQLVANNLQGHGEDFDAAILGDARLAIPATILAHIPYSTPVLIIAIIAGGAELLALTLLALYFTTSLGAFIGTRTKSGVRASTIALFTQLSLLLLAPTYLRSEGLWILIPLSVLNPATPLQILYTFLLSTVLFVVSLREIAR